jgi:hypothetical protein
MTTGQLSLFAEPQITAKPLKHTAFSHDAACPQIERLALEAAYGGLLNRSQGGIYTESRRKEVAFTPLLVRCNRIELSSCNCSPFHRGVIYSLHES